ncbi:MAG: efflux RND transporter periplasmic adaptor subunit, partial [Planctomycetes bacterium]|nr:efflux RND transporter periplasmic adaptor subunit [Planctomycetota bacterium]
GTPVPRQLVSPLDPAARAEQSGMLRVPAVLTCLLLLAACGGPGVAPPAKAEAPRFPVQVAQAVARPVQVEVTAPATVSPFEEVQVTALVAGAVARVLVREGDSLAAGQAVAEIDPERFAIQVEQARAAQARAQAVADDARIALGRREELGRTPGLVSATDLDQARARFAQAEADQARARADLAAAELDLRRSRVLAPAAGVVQERSVATGQYVQPGARLATLVRRDPLLLRFAVTTTDAALLKAGQEAAFTADGTPGSFRARILLVSESADQRSRQVPVVAEVLPEGAAALRGNAYAKAVVAVGSASPLVVVPDLAVRPSERGFLVFVLAADRRTVAERSVRLGARTRDGHIVVEHGVAAGETVVVRGAEPLRDGSAVQVEEPPAPAAAASGAGRR